jgi:hypothetical protein
MEVYWNRCRKLSQCVSDSDRYHCHSANVNESVLFRLGFILRNGETGVSPSIFLNIFKKVKTNMFSPFLGMPDHYWVSNHKADSYEERNSRQFRNFHVGTFFFVWLIR